MIKVAQAENNQVIKSTKLTVRSVQKQPQARPSKAPTPNSFERSFIFVRVDLFLHSKVTYSHFEGLTWSKPGKTS